MTYVDEMARVLCRLLSDAASTAGAALPAFAIQTL
jgi:hypothetical protein